MQSTKAHYGILFTGKYNWGSGVAKCDWIWRKFLYHTSRAENWTVVVDQENKRFHSNLGVFPSGDDLYTKAMWECVIM